MVKDMNKIGDIIRDARLENKMTISQLSELLGISDRYLLKIENENKIPSFKVMNKIVNVLTIDANEFYYVNYTTENSKYNQICLKLKNCDEYVLTVLEATLDAMMKYKNLNEGEKDD